MPLSIEVHESISLIHTVPASWSFSENKVNLLQIKASVFDLHQLF